MRPTSYQAATALLCLALCLDTAAQAADDVERRAPADPRGEVEIVNVSGDVQVRGWDRAEVQVNADLGSGVEKLEFTSEGKRTTIKVVLPRGRSSSGASDLIVQVPQASTLTINTVSADQTVTEVRGVQRLQAVSGTISTEIWAEEFEAKSVSGEIFVKGNGAAGIATIATVSGDIHATKLAGEVALNTVTGDMDIEMGELTRARIRTTNGDLDLITRLTRDARIDAEGINGDLSFMFTGAVDAQFDIETFNGAIDSCFGPKPARTREFAPGNELRFTAGSGTAKVRVKTLNGGVEICRH